MAEQKLVDIVKQWGDVPEFDTEADLEKWMVEHLRGAGKLPAKDEDENDEEEEAEPATPATDGTTQQIPRLSTFSGNTDSKTDVGFDLWSYEVRCLVNEGVYSQPAILQAIRRSLRGEAGRVVMRCGEGADVQQILDRLEAVYGFVDAGETALAQFYAAKQGKEENVTTWGCRLEDLLDKAKQVGLIADRDTDEMLRSRFWMGLRTDLKQTSRHKFDTVTSFDRLRVEIRMIEQEFKLAEQQTDSDQGKKKDGTAKMTCADGSKQKETSDMSELKGLYHKLANNVQSMQEAFQRFQMPGMVMQPQDQPMMQQQVRPQQQVRSDFNFLPNIPQQQQQGFRQQQPFQPRAPGSGPAPRGTGQQGFQPRAYGQGQRPVGNFGQPVGNFNSAGNRHQGAPQGQTQSCWHCGQTDHMKRNCPNFRCWNCSGVGHARRNCPYVPLNC